MLKQLFGNLLRMFMLICFCFSDDCLFGVFVVYFDSVEMFYIHWIYCISGLRMMVLFYGFILFVDYLALTTGCVW